MSNNNWYNGNILYFRNVKSMKDYGKNIEWPTPPSVLEGLVQQLRRVHNK